MSGFSPFSTCILKNFGIHSIWRRCGLHVVFITLDLRSVGLGSIMPPFQDPNSPFSMTACFTCTSAHLHILSYVLCKKLNIAETGRKDASNQKFAIENNLVNHSSQNVSLRQHRKLQKILNKTPLKVSMWHSCPHSTMCHQTHSSSTQCINHAQPTIP